MMANLSLEEARRRVRQFKKCHARADYPLILLTIAAHYKSAGAFWRGYLAYCASHELEPRALSEEEKKLYLNSYWGYVFEFPERFKINNDKVS